MVVFAKGGYLTQIIVHGPSATPALVTALAVQQYGRI